MKLICFFNWNLGYLTLQNLIQNKIEILAVVTNYDLRDKDIYRNKVYDLAVENGINVYKRYEDILNYLSDDVVGFSVAYGNEIFKKDILERIRIYNFHPSKLPSYKGPSPIEWQIKEGETEIGMSCHEVIEDIDCGNILSQEIFSLNVDQTYSVFLDEFNFVFAQFITKNVIKILAQKNLLLDKKNNKKGNYYHRIKIPSMMKDEKIRTIIEYLNRTRILFFAGNRAELGILMPLIVEFSKVYYVDLMVSDSYFGNGSSDYERIKEVLQEQSSCVNFVLISQRNLSYAESLEDIYRETYKYLNKQSRYQYKYAVVLGDRIEVMAFSLAAFYAKIPLVHVGGGDVANVAYYDTNIRHSISKLASLHMVFNEESKRTLYQLGEEDRRIVNIGNPAFDYKRLGMLLRFDEIKKEFHIADEKVVVFTYHACPFYDEDRNLMDFTNALTGVIESNIGKVIITYPNYDPGSKKIIAYIQELHHSNRIIIRESLGTIKLDTIMDSGSCIIVGNSSSGLLETLFYKVPSVNIGDRQTDRTRGINVYDVPPDKDKVKECINYIIDHFDDIVESISMSEQIYGDGYAGIKAVNFLDKYCSLDTNEIIIKNFVKRNIHD